MCFFRFDRRNRIVSHSSVIIIILYTHVCLQTFVDVEGRYKSDFRAKKDLVPEDAYVPNTQRWIRIGGKRTRVLDQVVSVF